MRLYIGNMSYDTTEDRLRTVFENYGAVESINLIADRETGRPKGFGFIEMPTDEEANAAIEGINGTDLDGRTVKVNVARARTENRGGGGGGGGRSW